MKKICIVGGGTAGLISALILKTRFSSLQIDLVKSDKIGIIGVGEGSTEHWQEFTNFVGIALKELITETDATFKGGIMFEDWTEKPYYHNVIDDILNIKCGQYQSGYAHAIINNLESIDYTNKHNWSNRINPDNLPKQFHFNTFKLNSFLLKKCRERNINIFNDEITKVNIENGQIQSIESDLEKYEHDFYIDSTGFKRLLISKLGVKWQSYSEYLPMNEAIAFPTPDTDEYTPYTLSKALSSGWMWRIPTNGRWGNGYVFNNKYINAEQAKKECEDYLGYEVEIGKNIKFEAGALQKAWVGNCVATGLSSSFIEPLEASSIGTSIQQAFMLMHLIINYKQTDIDLYNTRFNYIVENTRDFVLLHYLTGKKDSDFWREFKPNLPDTLKNNLDKWQHRLPIEEDFPGNYQLFNEFNFAIILKELDLINKVSIKKEYDSLSDHFKIYTNNMIEQHKYHFKDSSNTLGHKKYLQSYCYKYK
jgi:tryptophan halogenase